MIVGYSDHDKMMNREPKMGSKSKHYMDDGVNLQWIG